MAILSPSVHCLQCLLDVGKYSGSNSRKTTSKNVVTNPYYPNYIQIPGQPKKVSFFVERDRTLRFFVLCKDTYKVSKSSRSDFRPLFSNVCVSLPYGFGGRILLGGNVEQR